MHRGMKKLFYIELKLKLDTTKKITNCIFNVYY